MRGPSTTVVHGDREHHHGAGIAPAIHQTAAFASASDAEFSAAATELRGERFYTRYGNPNHAQVAEVVADLEGAEAGLVTVVLSESTNDSYCFASFSNDNGWQDWRSINSVGSTTRFMSSASPLISRRSIVAAVRPSSRRGACTVVRGGFMISV